MIGKAAICGAALLMWATPATAQVKMLPWRDLVFLNISGAGQSGSQTTTTNFSFELYEEQATVDTSREVKGSSFFDFTVGAAVLDNIGAALSIWTRSDAGEATIHASIPDPIQFDHNRTVDTTQGGMTHRETWIGIQGLYGFGLTPKVDVMILGGPAIAKVEHDVPISSTVAETPSGPTVTLQTQRQSKSLVGYIFGVDVRYMFTKNFGAGGFVRVAGASGTFDDPNSTDIKVGGPQFGVGLRVRY